MHENYELDLRIFLQAGKEREMHRSHDTESYTFLIFFQLLKFDYDLGHILPCRQQKD